MHIGPTGIGRRYLRLTLVFDQTIDRLRDSLLRGRIGPWFELISFFGMVHVIVAVFPFVVFSIVVVQQRLCIGG